MLESVATNLIPVDTEFIIRYISLGKFIELLDSKSLHLGRVDLFEDKTEGEWYAHLAREANEAISDKLSPADREKDENQLLEEISYLKQRSYVSSWFSSDYLSIAMWKLYGVTDEGIAFRVSKKKLEELEGRNKDYIDELKAEILISNVIYVSEGAVELKKIIDTNLSREQWLKFRNLLLKHKAYQFEEEYRMSVILPEGREDYPLGIKLSLGDSVNDFIDSVYLNPLIHSNHWYIRVVKKMLEVFGIQPDKLKLGEIRTSLG